MLSHLTEFYGMLFSFRFTTVTDYCGDIPVAFAENKIDLIDESVLNQKEVESMAKNHKLRLYRTSAKADHNVTEVFNYLVTKIVKKYPDPFHISRQSSADSMRGRVGSTPSPSRCSDVDHSGKNRMKRPSSLSIEINGEELKDSPDLEPSRRRTRGVKPVMNRHAIANKCRVM